MRHRSNGLTAAHLFLARRRGGSPGAEGQGQFTAFDIDDRQNDDMVRLSISDRRPLLPGLQFEVNSAGQWMRVERLNPIVQTGELAGDFLSKHQFWTLEPRVHHTTRHLRPLTLGAEYRFERQRDELFGTETARVLALYAQNRFEIGAHELELGVRLDNHSLYGSELNPRMSAAARLREGLVLRAAIGRAFVSPSFDILFKPTEIFPRAVGDVIGETGNRDLQPEVVWAADAGVRWQTERSQGEAAVYLSRYRDLIQPVVVRLERDGILQPFLSHGNIAKARISGVELGQTLRLHTHCGVQLSYTFQRASSEDAAGVNRNLQGRLRQKLAYRIRLGESSPLGLSFRADWQDRYFEDNLYVDEPLANNGSDEDAAEAAIGAPGTDWRYVTVGVNGRYELTPAIVLQADIANLLDERYQSVFGIPQPGLIATAGFRLQLD